MPLSVFRWAAPLFALEARRWRADAAAAFARWLRPSLPLGGALLDLGGGTGRLGELLATELSCAVTVLDSSPQMLRYAARKGLTTVLGDAAATPFGDASFNAVIVVDAFHHFRRQRAVAGEVARVLVPGGALVVAEADPTDRGVKRARSWERLLGEPAAFCAPAELSALFACTGIEGAVYRQGASSYVFVGRRESAPACGAPATPRR